MCLITKQKEPIILKKDLKVWKVVNEGEGEKDVRSLSFYFRYKLNKQYNQHLLMDNHPETYADDIVSEHYKFHKPSNTFNQVASKMTNVHQGFHFYKTLKRLNRAYHKERRKQNYYVVIKCTIPKGSEVFYDETGLGVANQIIINKIRE